MLTKMLGSPLLVLLLALPAWARDPAEPGVRVPPARYSPVTSGTKSFRPVEPLPWGDINRRVTPPEEGKAAPQGKEQKGGPHGQR
jgi:hypothetical protein